MTIIPDESGSKLAVIVAPDAEPVNTTLQYQVADATDEPSRYAWGTVTISVQDRPDPVTGAQVTGFGDGTLDVAFGAGAFNNSPITGYEIALLGPESGDVLSASTCAATTCTVATPGNGQANAVVVRVRAQNGIGFSDARRGARCDLVRCDSVRASGTSRAAARRTASDRVGAGLDGIRKRRQLVRRHGRRRLQRSLRLGRVHGERVRRRVGVARERQPRAGERQRTQRGISRARVLDRVGDDGNAVRPSHRGRDLAWSATRLPAP